MPVRYDEHGGFVVRCRLAFDKQMIMMKFAGKRS